jgi:cell division protein FtsQ
MPAVCGGDRLSLGDQVRAKRPQVRAKASRRPGGAQPSAAKLHAAKGVGLSPTVALTVAGAALGLGLVIMLATGHRAERIGVSMVHRRRQLVRFGGLQVEDGSHPAAPRRPRKATFWRPRPLPEPADAGHGPELTSASGCERVGWVKDAKVIRMLPDTIVVAVDERPPAPSGSTRAAPEGDRRRRPGDQRGRSGPLPPLPLVVGAGRRPGAAPSILPAIASAAAPALIARGPGAGR